MAATRSRQLLLDVFSSFLQADKASSLSASTALPALAHQLAEATGKVKEIFGADEAAKKEVEVWLSKVDADQAGDLQSLEKQLQSKTYLAGPTPTAADIALLGSLYPTVSQLKPAEQYATPSVARYVSHLSHLYSAQSLVAPWEPQYEGMPALERKDPAADKKAKSKDKAEAAAGASKEAKKQGKGDVAASAAIAAAATAGAEGAAAAAVTEGSEGKKQKKEKKEKAAAAGGQGQPEGKKKEKPAKGGAAAAEPATPIPSMIDLRVGKIVDIKKHPDADSLYLETVDFGEPEGPRIVLSGLVNFVPIEKMQDRWVVGICNLKPVAMRGIKSYAMLLCATAKEGKDGGVEPISPPEGSQPGDRVEVEGYEGMTPIEQLNPKKKIFEAIQPDYTTTDNKEAAWVGGDKDGNDKRVRLIKTAKGVCYTATFAGASLS
ncbi:unnamed protein product [Parajaminaea phylloscopi]